MKQALNRLLLKLRENMFLVGSKRIGIHRLVRISPFDLELEDIQALLVFGLSNLDENIKVEIHEKDLRIDT